ncbi:hypothetical protein ACFL45_03070 [Candidatus Neomarinimicrobiota bacterium]
MSPTLHSAKQGRQPRRLIAYIAVFGSLWGLAEASLGTTLHLLKIPFSGLILTAIALNIILIARAFYDAPGSTISIALLAAVIKALSLSTIKVGPIVGILMEGLLAEAILTLIGPGRTGFLIAGLSLGIYPLVQSIITRTILFGAAFVPMILELVEGLSNRVGSGFGWILLITYVILHVVIGLAAAGIAWTIRRHTAAKLTAMPLNEHH